MRQIGTIEDEGQARRLTDYLLSLGIETKVDPGPAGRAIWVRDENKLDRAREALAEFRADPSDPKFDEARGVAEQRRRDEARAERAYQKRVSNVGERSFVREWRRRPATSGLILASIAVSLLTNFGGNLASVMQYLTFESYHRGPGGFRFDDPGGLGALGRGQVWRAVTPIFLHFDGFHLLFNMWWLLDFGRLIEDRKGTARFLVLVAVSAAVSNFAEHIWNVRFDDGPTMFGGMSGVVYALLGYIWGKMVFDLGDGIAIHPRIINFMVIWLVICMTGAVGPIANGTHVAGLVVGLVFGAMRY